MSLLWWRIVGAAALTGVPMHNAAEEPGPSWGPKDWKLRPQGELRPERSKIEAACRKWRPQAELRPKKPKMEATGQYYGKDQAVSVAISPLVTACAVATSSCISDVPSQWEGRNLDPHSSHIFQPILMKLETKKDIRDTTPHAKFGWCGTTGRGSA